MTTPAANSNPDDTSRPDNAPTEGRVIIFDECELSLTLNKPLTPGTRILWPEGVTPPWEERDPPLTLPKPPVAG